jgi:hypothetical protein
MFLAIAEVITMAEVASAIANAVNKRFILNALS